MIHESIEEDSSMVTVAITLPEEMLIFVEAQVAEKRLANPSEYLRALIAGAQQEQEQADLEARFAAAMRAVERGEPNPLTPDDWRMLQQRILNAQAS
jgi:Arc/MetJ-type ribon-helix-helix transcriptional regulator